MGNSELSPSKLIKNSPPKVDCCELAIKLFAQSLKNQY